MKQFILCLVAAISLFSSCGQSYEEKRKLSQQQRREQMRQDSAALKVAVLPTLDCLPIFIAKDMRLFDTLGVDIRLKTFTAQLDIDTAFMRSRVELAVTDLVRAQRMKKSVEQMDYLSSTSAEWTLFTSKNARVKELKQLDEKMIGMTRFSATDMLADRAADSAKLKRERVFKIQINDVRTRTNMLRNAQIDAAFLTEPYATEARQFKAISLTDTKRQDLRLGAIVVNQKQIKGKERKRQLDAFKTAYNQAVDSINRHGLKHYSAIIEQRMGVSPKVAGAIGKCRFEHLAPPRSQDIEKAKKWYERN